MLPPAIADHLNRLGHDAVGVTAAGLAGADDTLVYVAAVEQNRVMVTENFADFSVIVTRRLASDEPCVPVVFVRKKDFPPGGALANQLADQLRRWAIDNPEPYPGPHWP